MGNPEELGLIRLATRFPRLTNTHVRLTSPEDPAYNCLAWAGGDTRRWWHPSAFGGLYWPEGPTEDTLDAWIEAFSWFGYAVCESARREPGREKLAIYADGELPLHVARQLETGYWTSKLGGREDIEHELEGLVGMEYGRVVVILSRSSG